MRTKLWVFLGLLAVTQVSAQSGGDFEIVRSTLDGGGGRSTGGDFELNGTIAQPEADPQFAAGGDFSLRGGFHRAGEAVAKPELIFEDSFED